MIYFLFFVSAFVIYFEEEVRKYALQLFDFMEFIHNNNPLLLQYYDCENEYLEFNHCDELEEEKLEEEKQLEKKELYEDKYLKRFKNFTNEYLFNEKDLEYEENHFNELVKYHNSIAKTLELKFVNSSTILTHLVTCEENLKEKLLIKYPNGEMEKISDENDETEFDSETYNDYYKLCDLQDEIIDERNKLEKLINELKILQEKKGEELEYELKKEAHKNMIENKLNGFINNYLIETTPVGNVIMRFNNDKKSFEYYSNHSVPYRYLEPIGRKYVLTYKCKSIFIDIDEEIEKVNKLNEMKKVERKDKNVEMKKDEIKDKKFERKDKKDKKDENKIFRSSIDKSHKRDEILPNKNSQTIINPINNIDIAIKNANRYTWEGRFNDFKIIKTEKKSNANKISFKEFKRRQLSNKI
jgi:hypothetical protein